MGNLSSSFDQSKGRLEDYYAPMSLFTIVKQQNFFVFA